MADDALNPGVHVLEVRAGLAGEGQRGPRVVVHVGRDVDLQEIELHGRHGDLVGAANHLVVGNGDVTLFDFQRGVSLERGDEVVGVGDGASRDLMRPPSRLT